MKKFNNKEELLKEILKCLNQIPNKSIDSSFFKNTYEICEEINKYIKKEKPSKFKQLKIEYDSK